MSEELTIGIDLGGTNIKGVLINTKGIILEDLSLETKDGTGDPEGNLWKEHISRIAGALKKKSAGKVRSLGFSAPGLADPDNKSIAYMPKRLKGLENFDPGKYLGINAWVLNDAHAHLIAESKLGSGKGYKNIVLLTLGSGVGGAVLIEGRLYQGEIGRAGHLGHISVNQSETVGITGTPGSLENAIGECTIVERSYGRYKSTADLVKAFEAGNNFASWVWLQSLENLARGLISMINTFSPQLIILSGGITDAGESLIKPLREFIEIYEWRPGGYTTEIKLASKGRSTGALGAAIFAITRNQKP